MQTVKLFIIYDCMGKVWFDMNDVGFKYAAQVAHTVHFVQLSYIGSRILKIKLLYVPRLLSSSF